MADHSDDTREDVEPVEDEDAAALDAYDLDDDGKISLIEDARARIGLVDARMEQLAEDEGVKGTLAKAAHEILDKLDNDD